jgi:hypothetical protein
MVPYGSMILTTTGGVGLMLVLLRFFRGEPRVEEKEKRIE